MYKIEIFYRSLDPFFVSYEETFTALTPTECWDKVSEYEDNEAQYFQDSIFGKYYRREVCFAGFI